MNPRTARRDVAVTGLGLLTPAGIGAADCWEALCAGRSAAAPDPALEDLPTNFSCRVPGFDPDAELTRRTARGLDRFAQLALVAARDAVADAGLDPRTWDGARVGVVVGNSLGGTETWERQHRELLENGLRRVSPMSVPMAMVNMVAGAVSTDLHALGPSIVPATACASGTLAIGLARDLLLAGTCDIVVAGGAEAALTPFVVGGLSRLGGLSVRTDSPGTASRPFDRDRDGFVAAEGAGMVVLERAEDVVARGGRIRSRVIGFGSSCDAHHPTSPEPGSAGVERAIRASLADAGICGREVDHVNAHGTSTPLNDVAEASVIRKVYGDRPLVTSTKGVTGHALGAAGAIEAAFTVLAMEHKAVPPTANVNVLDPGIDVDVVTEGPRNRALQVATSHSFGFGGHNAVLVLGAA